jgi:hypothetical protein
VGAGLQFRSMSRLGGGVVRALACALAVSAIMGTAAAAAEPLPFVSLTPEDGAVLTQTAGPGIQWYMTGGPKDAYGIYVRVSSTPDVGTDGQTLSDLHTLDYFVLGRSSTDVGVFRGVSNAGPTRWPNYPGTYYWQASANWTEYIPDDPNTPQYDGQIVNHSQLSPIRRITVTAPQQPTPPAAPPAAPPNPLRMTTAMARYFVRATIRAHTHREPVGLTYGCARSTITAFICHPVWRDRIFAYRATAQMRNTSAIGTTVYARVGFDGKRAKRSCLRKKKSFTRCATKVHWLDG